MFRSVHDMKTDKDIESENLRLERSPIDSVSKERIRAFLTDLRINNASNDRIIVYSHMLDTFCYGIMLKCKFSGKDFS